ncbi:Uma2 family endonuclease [Dyadobacter luticola]|uniref:Uma2 family endonuclease n=1 Tax=Dyadobacter luticola TaxID=1979387 RepID=A0A5R9KQ12_9BACT|nr:Uma2 family endonuclease [Dyadobacter luticola]TLU98270.1 Uma2 family endonuclease [Dyadobacter luticola]
MGQAQMAGPKYTVPEYLEMEEKSDIRHEYYDGEIFAMAGTTMNHNEIVDNVRTILKDFFKPFGCRVFAENVKVEAIENLYYPYPDVIVTCAPDDISGRYIVKQPSVLVEVLSKSSASYDRGFKLRQYKKIDSLIYYMLVSQNEFYVELYSRTNQPDIWSYQTFDNAEDTIHLEKLDFEIEVSEIYDNIVFIPDEDQI